VVALLAGGPQDEIRRHMPGAASRHGRPRGVLASWFALRRLGEIRLNRVDNPTSRIGKPRPRVTPLLMRCA
jgi:hypothetical protein